MKKLLAVIFVALLSTTACKPAKIEPERNVDARTIQLPAIEWRIRTQEELNDIYRKNGNHLPEGMAADGFIGRDGDLRVVMYTLRPTRLNDRTTCTIGHEILHEAYGNYHK